MTCTLLVYPLRPFLEQLPIRCCAKPKKKVAVYLYLYPVRAAADPFPIKDTRKGWEWGGVPYTVATAWEGAR